MDKFNPSSFYLGVVEFFAILLPGILLAYILIPFFESYEIGLLIPLPSNEFASLGMFLLLAYILGNLLMAIGSTLLDERLYNIYRKRNLQKHGDITYAIAAKIKSVYIPNTILQDFYKEESNEKIAKFNAHLKEFCESHNKSILGSPGIYNRNFEINTAEWDNFLDNIKAIENTDKEEMWWQVYWKSLFRSTKKPTFYATEVLNVFKWSQAYFRFENPEALAEIKRLEADSKFFRSLTVAMPIITILFIIQMVLQNNYAFSSWILVGTSLLVVFPFFWRYADLRHKSTEKAYELIITYHQIKSI